MQAEPAEAEPAVAVVASAMPTGAATPVSFISDPDSTYMHVCAYV